MKAHSNIQHIHIITLKCKKHSPGITNVRQLFQITALPQDPFPELDSNNPENEENEKTKKKNIA
jgi:hypothetical protein